MLHNHLEERIQIFGIILKFSLCNSFARDGEDVRKIDLRIVGTEHHEQIEDHVDNLHGTCGRLVDFIDDDNWFYPQLKGLFQNKFCLRHGAFLRVDKEQNAVDCPEDTLHLGAEVGVSRRIDDVDLAVLVFDRRVLGVNRDPALALLIVAVHHEFPHVLMRRECTALCEEGIDERCLPVVDVRDNGDITDGHACREKMILTMLGSHLFYRKIEEMEVWQPKYSV